MADQTDDAVVRYGVKELLALQGETLKRIETKVDANALSQAESIGKLDTRVALLEAKPDLEPRLMLLEATDNRREGESALKRYALPLGLTAVYTAIAVITFFHGFH